MKYAIMLTGANRTLYALRTDGAVFVLVRRGDLLPDGSSAKDPHWAAVPAIPGTEAAKEQEG